MLDPDPPPATERKIPDFVSPSSAHHASRSSTPGISSPDRAQDHLHLLSLPPRPHSAPPPPAEMAVNPLHFSGDDRWAHSVHPTGCRIRPEQDMPLERMLPIRSPEVVTVEVPSPDEPSRHVPCLQDLAHSLRVQKYHKRRYQQAQRNLHSSHITAVHTSRLAWAARSVQHTLAECIKSEDKESFVNLFSTFQDACDRVQQHRVIAVPSVESESQSIEPEAVSFFEHLSSETSSSLLEFTAKLRHNGVFVADCLSRLTHRELIRLLPDRKLPRSSDSILAGSSRSTSRTSRPLGYLVDAQVDQITSRNFGSALETLVLAPMGLSSQAASEIDRLTDIWATVCCRIIADQKPGCERLVPAVMDLWASLLPWPGKNRLEVWILQVLRDGNFLFEPNKRTFRSRAENGREIASDDDQRTKAFYAQATASLLDLFADQTGASLIPPGVLKLCHATWNKLHQFPGHQRAFSQFVSTRWLFSSFLPDVVTLPEAHHIMSDHYFSETARHRILREVAALTQTAALQVVYPWKHDVSVPAETIRRVNSIASRFEGVVFSTGSSLVSPEIADPHLDFISSKEDTFVAVSLNDFCVLMNALYPQRRPASVSSDPDHTRSGLQSSASSMSGFSLFGSAYSSDSIPPAGLNQPDAFSRSPFFENDNLGSDYTSMREACQELEELATHRATDTRENWEVLLFPSAASNPSTIARRYAELLAPRPELREVRETQVLTTPPWNHDKQRTICRKAVEIVLQHSSRKELLQIQETFTSRSAELSYVVDLVQNCLEEAIRHHEDRSEFVVAHELLSLLQDFDLATIDSFGLNAFHESLLEIECSARQSIDRAQVIEHVCEAWDCTMKTNDPQRLEQLDSVATEATHLRDKMWYVADVRTSAMYDHLRSVANALRIMGRPKVTKRARVAPPLRHWSGSKVSNIGMHLKNEVPTLEILSVTPDQGGPNKLSDDQAKAVAEWIKSNGIDNICIGEERIHKLCMEIRKCVDAMIASPIPDNSTLLRNSLFTRDGSFGQQTLLQKKMPLFSGMNGAYLAGHSHTLRTNIRSQDTLSNTSQTLSSMSSRDFADLRSPTLTHKSSIPFWSPNVTEAESPSTATSVGSSMTQSALNISSRKRQGAIGLTNSDTLEGLRQRTVSLLLSDLSANLFAEGSETDVAFWTGLGWELTDRHFKLLRTLPQSAGSETPRVEISTRPRRPINNFGYETAFANILAKFAAVSNPITKLACLYDLDRLLIPYMAQKHLTGAVSPPFPLPRDVEKSQGLTNGAVQSGDPAVRGFRHLFMMSSLRPATIFRDIQYIASLVPSFALHNTPQGKAFCNALVALSQLKREARILMVETAANIVAYHSNNRGHGRTPSAAQQQRDSATFAVPSRTPSAEDVSRFTMADAAHLYQITAKEGDPVAQRELATLYLTHPDLMDRIIAPFARPKDVFKEELESKWRKNQHPNRCDPSVMCVAHHWMHLSSKGGDGLAKEFLKQREEMERLGS